MGGETRGLFYVTTHAVGRYLEGVRRNAITPADALRELIDLTSTGRRVGPYNGRGIRARVGPDVRLELWRGPRVGTSSQRLAQSRIRFVVAYGEGDLPQVITVLPAGPKRWRDEDP